MKKYLFLLRNFFNFVANFLPALSILSISSLNNTAFAAIEEYEVTAKKLDVSRNKLAPSIDASGFSSISVELIKSCNNPRLNQLLLRNLRKWKFAPANIAGVTTASTQDIKVNFKVE